MKTKQYIVLLCLLLLLPLSLWADVNVTLKTGEVVRGNIEFENEAVVVIRDMNNSRLQYLRADIENIEAVESGAGGEADSSEQDGKTKKTNNRIALALQVHGGGTVVPNKLVGGAVGGKLLLGAGNMLDRRIFLGAGVGYTARIVDGTVNNFLPIQLVGIVPLTKTESAPYLGVAAGYGFRLDKNYSGGIVADIDLGWRKELVENKALLLSLYTTFQKGEIKTTETIAGNLYEGKSQKAFVDFGARITIML